MSLVHWAVFEGTVLIAFALLGLYNAQHRHLEPRALVRAVASRKD